MESEYRRAASLQNSCQLLPTPPPLLPTVRPLFGHKTRRPTRATDGAPPRRHDNFLGPFGLSFSQSPCGWLFLVFNKAPP